MRKWLAALGVSLFAAVPAAAQSNTWILVAPSSGGFSVRMPDRPETMPVTSDLWRGIRYEIHLYRLVTPAVIYLAGWTDYHQPIDMEREFDADRDNFLKGVKGRLTGETRISQGDVVGRDFTGEIDDGTFVVSRLFGRGSMVWQAAAMLRPGKDDTRSALRFLYSLQVAGQ